MGCQDERRRPCGQPKGETVDGELPPPSNAIAYHRLPGPWEQMGVQARRKNTHMDAVQSGPRRSRRHTAQ
eukprot:3270107-Pyramimonas_sp.AAC.1